MSCYLEVLNVELIDLLGAWSQNISVGTVGEDDLIHVVFQVLLQRPHQSRDVEVWHEEENGLVGSCEISNVANLNILCLIEQSE